MITAAACFGGLSCSALGVRGRGGSGAASSSTSASAAAATPAERVAEAALGSLTVRKWRLPNGLHVITLPDPLASSISYMTFFQVGSRYEDAATGETGLAHLFEHLMFTQTRGTGTVTDFDEVLEIAGGSANAMTAHDFTAYTDQVPPGELPRVIRLEADRMMGLDLRPEDVQTERDVVIEERLATVEDDVDGLMEEAVYRQAFRTHPYRWPVIGLMDHIKAVTRDRVLSFYRRHYAPNRAVIVVVGRFDESDALRRIAEAYGALPPSPTEEPPIAPERAPTTEVRAHVVRPLPADRLAIAFAAPAFGDEGRAAYDVMAELLVGGPSSRLHRQLIVERGMASSVRSDLATTRDPALWTVWVQMTKGHRAAEAEAVLLAEIDRLIAQLPPETEMNAARNRLEAAFWGELGSSEGKAEALGVFDLVTGDFRHLMARGAAYARVTAEDVRRCALEFLGSKARSVVIANPDAPSGTTTAP